MKCLVFYRNNQPVMRRELKENITVGRDSSCDIQLIEEDISRIHVNIQWNGQHYVISDKSTNGTFINGNKLETEKPLSENDTIAIGEWRIKLESVSTETRETVVRDYQPTKVLKYESKKKELLSEIIELTHIPPTGSKKSYKVSQASIGAGPNNDIIISDDPYISGNHCIIKCMGEKFLLEDLKSKNGTVYDNEKIIQMTLPKKGEFSLGKTKFKFEIKQVNEKVKPTVMTSLGPIIGKSLPMRELFSLIQKIAGSDATACIIGASGTGKELIARHIHEVSPRHTRPFVALNCGAIPENLIESELFGHERGSFTNATAMHQGVFEQASGGTLFLDEIGEMPLELQTRLLRVLENREIRRIGGKTDVPVNVRIIAATNADLKNSVYKGTFREDLFFRLYVVPLIIPPLAERKEDVEVLVKHFLSSLSPTGAPKNITNEALEKLSAYNWPGNVRELRNTIQRAILVSTNDSIDKRDIIFSNLSDCRPSNTNGSLLPLEDQEKSSVLSALASSEGNASKAARKLGVARTTLNSMMRRFGIDAKEYKAN